jgi:Methyltransferase domain
MANGGRAHWEHVYETRAENELSWFQEHPSISLDLIRATGMKPNSAIIDIGGGESRLVDALLDEGFHALTVLDLSETALAAVKARLGSRSAKVTWIAADVTSGSRPNPTTHGRRRTLSVCGARDEGRAAGRPCHYRHIRAQRSFRFAA